MRRRLPEFLGKADEKTLGSADVAELVGILISDDIADKLGAVRAQPFNGLFDIVDCEHGSQITKGVHRSVAMISDDFWSEEA
jgi:hypothetical protein